MDFKRFGSRILLRIDRGEEIVETIKKFCEDQKIKLGSISGIGAVGRAKIGIFDVEKQEYFAKEFVGDHEITNMTGNVSTMNGETYLHIHVTIAGSDLNTFGGHLNKAVISATSEIFIDVIDDMIDREFNEEVGLNTLKF